MKKIILILIAVGLSFALKAQMIQDQKIIYSNTQTFQDSIKMSGLSGSGTSLVIDENGVISKGSGGAGATSINGLSDGTTVGTSNVGLGTGALSNNTGSANTASGYNALYENTTGQENTALGYVALYENTTGYFNTALGVAALLKNIGGAINTAIGYSSLYNNISGNRNIGIGNAAGYAITTGSNNTIIGDYSGTTALSNTVVIAAGTTERLKITATSFSVNGVPGVSGTFTTADSKTVTVTNGIITEISIP